MDTTLTSSPKRYRAFGILFFLSGATFHCIDLLGVERTFAWVVSESIKEEKAIEAEKNKIEMNE